MTIKAASAPRCYGLPSSFDMPSRMVHPRARELYEHLRTFPWDVSCLTYLRCRHEIFPEVFSGKSTTTKLVEYLVELRFLANALKGWSEVSLGRSPHHLAPLDKRFITYSIANAYHELPEVFKELVMVKDRSYSSAVKKYCDEVYESLNEIYNNSDVKALCENVKQCPIPMEH
ncbi:hypothetical protein K440DRAFT_662284 [Wilcoxina mikolae CBS 423.85]|nr:hypothetical protein K440DRAFT_662284 [Wilcoxina mikolae CBS 423.85]KAF8538825.1 hypothetical protein BDD12DRAFT_126571 [Trichophaea hybrida]